MALIDQQYIFGIRVNGASQLITKLSISDNQSDYDYICNVAIENQWNGNGRFGLSIVNSDRIEGMPIGRWTLLNGRIGYDWGGSSASFIMEDENGNLTNRISAGTGKGSASGFSVETLARSIFTKANEIVDRFPSAQIVNAYLRVEDDKPTASSLLMYKETDDKKYFIDRFENYTIKPLSTYLERFRELEVLLKGSEDIRCKRLLTQVTDECVKIIKMLH